MDYKVVRTSDYNNELYHWGTKKNHKYVARVKDKRGKWRYFYTREEYRAYLRGEDPKDSKLGKKPQDAVDNNKVKGLLNQKGHLKLSSFASSFLNRGKQKVNQILNSIRRFPSNVKKKITRKGEEFAAASLGLLVGGARKIPGTINKGVDGVRKVVKELYDGPNNMYDINPKNYKKKIAKIKESPEWKDIVKRKDPEYVRKKPDGTYEYRIDDYVAKKKNPILDVADDIVNNRKVTVNKINRNTVVAGIKQTCFQTLALGMFAVGAVSKFMIEKSKLYQGTYQDEIKNLNKQIQRGSAYVEQYTKNPSKVSKSDVDQVMRIIDKSAQVAVQTAQKPENQQKAKEALEILTNESSSGDYETAANTLTELSEADIRYINELLRQQSIKRGQQSMSV